MKSVPVLPTLLAALVLTGGTSDAFVAQLYKSTAEFASKIIRNVGMDWLATGDWCPTCGCCIGEVKNANLQQLSMKLSSSVAGQRLATETVFTAVERHIRSQQPQKPLVLSFHGQSGVGKTLVAYLLIKHLFAKGLDSNYYKLFIAMHHFIHKENVNQDITKLQETMKRAVQTCPYTVFIFDFMEHMPARMINFLLPLTDHHRKIDGVDYRKAIFIFISNTGAEEISKYTMENGLGQKRVDLKLEDFQTLLTEHAATNNWWHAAFVQKGLLKHVIPFLPLEKPHVLQCIRLQLKQRFDELCGKGEEAGGMDKAWNDLRYFYKKFICPCLELDMNHWSVKEICSKGFVPSEAVVRALNNAISYRPKKTPVFSSIGCKFVHHVILSEVEE